MGRRRIDRAHRVLASGQSQDDWQSSLIRGGAGHYMARGNDLHNQGKPAEAGVHAGSS